MYIHKSWAAVDLRAIHAVGWRCYIVEKRLAAVNVKIFVCPYLIIFDLNDFYNILSMYCNEQSSLDTFKID